MELPFAKISRNGTTEPEALFKSDFFFKLSIGNLSKTFQLKYMYAFAQTGK